MAVPAPIISHCVVELTTRIYETKDFDIRLRQLINMSFNLYGSLSYGIGDILQVNFDLST